MPFWYQAYDGTVYHATINSFDDTGCVPTIFHESKPRANSDLANHIESVELQQFPDVESLAILGIFFESLDKYRVTGVYKWLV